MFMAFKDSTIPLLTPSSSNDTISSIRGITLVFRCNGNFLSLTDAHNKTKKKTQPQLRACEWREAFRPSAFFQLQLRLRH